MSTGKETPIDVQYGSCDGHLLLTKNLEISVRVGGGLDASSPNFFSNAGIGWGR